ncbi:MAG: hypothetical protein AMS26_08475 [Bacteroides sp. SM23_62]|nr:MAG: hypothetical protein AMS26_08475 [Bacteroides sp. SM23_62]
MSNLEKTVGSFRSAIQDLLVPELKAIRTELEHHKEEFQKIDQRFQNFQQELRDLREEMNRRFEANERENYRRFEAVMQSIHNVEKTQERILERLDVKEQVADLETKFVRIETKFNRFEDFMQQWKSNFKEKKPQINLETVES